MSDSTFARLRKLLEHNLVGTACEDLGTSVDDLCAELDELEGEFKLREKALDCAAKELFSLTGTCPLDVHEAIIHCGEDGECDGSDNQYEECWRDFVLKQGREAESDG